MNIIGIKILNTTHLYDDAVTNKHGQRTECEDRAKNLKFIICKNVRLKYEDFFWKSLRTLTLFTAFIQQ